VDAEGETFTTERNIHAPEGTICISNFSRRFRSDYDFMWFMTFPEEAVKHPLTCLGFHADTFWEDGYSHRPTVGAQYAYLGEGGVSIGVLNSKDNWKCEDVGRRLGEGEVYEKEFEAPYPGIPKGGKGGEACGEGAGHGQRRRCRGRGKGGTARLPMSHRVGILLWRGKR